MLLHLYKVPEALFITVTVVTVLFALNKVNAGKTGRVIMLAGIGLGALLAVTRAVSHEIPKIFCQWFFPGKTDIPDNDINLVLWYAGLCILIPLNILLAVFFRKKGSDAGKNMTAVFSALLTADLISYKAWTVIWAPFHFEMGDNGVLSDVFLLRLAGWLTALMLLTVYIRFLYKCCMRLHEDPVIWNDRNGRPGCSGHWVLRLTGCLMTFLLILVFYGLTLQAWSRTRSLRPDWLPEILPQIRSRARENPSQPCRSAGVLS